MHLRTRMEWTAFVHPEEEGTMFGGEGATVKFTYDCEKRQHLTIEYRKNLDLCVVPIDTPEVAEAIIAVLQGWLTNRSPEQPLTNERSHTHG